MLIWNVDDNCGNSMDPGDSQYIDNIIAQQQKAYKNMLIQKVNLDYELFLNTIRIL